MRPESEPIEPYQLIAGLIDRVDIHFDANGTTARMVQKLKNEGQRPTDPRKAKGVR